MVAPWLSRLHHHRCAPVVIVATLVCSACFDLPERLSSLVDTTTGYDGQPPDSTGDVAQVDDRIRAVAPGREHVCVLRYDGVVVCWGSREAGQLGDGRGVGADAIGPPTVVGGLPPITALASGNRHTLALGQDGQVYCWGDNRVGQCGLAGQEYVPAPEPVAVKADRVFAGTRQSCALVGTELLCWGLLLNGQYDWTETGGMFSVAPIAVPGFPAGEVTALGIGTGQACAVVDTEVYCWGTGGQLGQDNAASSAIPLHVEALQGRNTTALATATESVVVITDGGTSLMCWGSSANNTCGPKRDAGDPVLTPRQIDFAEPPATPLAAVTGSWHAACVLDADGEVLCWGFDYFGIPGPLATASTEVPLPVPMPAAPRGVAAGRNVVCAMTGDDALACWGDNSTGQLGRGVAGAKHNPYPLDISW